MSTPWCSSTTPGHGKATFPKLGVALRRGIHEFLTSRLSFLDCVEVDAEWYFLGERPNFALRDVGAQELGCFASEFDLGIRTLALSLGTPGPLSSRYLQALKQLTDKTKPTWISGHIAFSRFGHIDLGAALPVPPLPDSIETLSEHVTTLSDTLSVPVLLENVFSHLRFRGAVHEAEFINRLCEAANCGFLLDINVLQNLSISCGFDAFRWILDIDPLHIKQLRVSMSSRPADGSGHVDAGRDRLLTETLRHASVSSIILEHDPGDTDFARLTDEIRRVRTLVEEALSPTAGVAGGPDSADTNAKSLEFRRAMPPREYAMTTPLTQGDRCSGIRLLAGVNLLFLGDGGILFSEPHQELHELNSGATFIWCCLEEGLTSSEIVTRYLETFGDDRCQAKNLVFEMLEWWQSLGFLAPVQIRSTITTHLGNAIAVMMRNPILRELFRESTNDVALLLNIAPHHLDTFLSIDPDNLEQQALLTEQQRRWIRSPDYGKQGAINDSPVALHKKHVYLPCMATEHRYRLLSTVFQLEYQTDREFEQIHPVIQHLAAESHDEPSIVLRLAVEDSSTILLEEGQPREVCDDAGKLAPLVISRFRRIATARYDFLAKIHAGVVSNGNACAVFPAQAGSGKTTLIAALVASGFRYFSDEYALLETETLNVSPVPFAMTVKDGSVDVLSDDYPGLAQLPVHLRVDNKRVRYLLPPLDNCALRMDESLPIKWVVFPRYDASEETRLIPVDQTTALRRLLDQCLVLPEDLDLHKVQRLIRWFRNVECYELPLSSLATAVKLMERVMGAR